MLRILDRQRYWSFFKAYVISFVSLVGLYIVIDAFSNIDEFTKIKTGVGELFRHMGYYYLVRVSYFYDKLCGVITMMAAIFTITWMQKNNELLAMLAAGISAKRVIFPVIISAGLVSCLSVLNQEFVMPRISEDLQRKPDDDGNIPVFAGSRHDVNEIQLNGRQGYRSHNSVDHFSALLPISRFGALIAIDAQLARYIPDKDLKSPLRGGWLLWQAILSPAGSKPDGKILLEVPPEMVSKFPGHYGAGPPPPGAMMFLRSDITFTNIIRTADWYQFARTPDLVRAYADQKSHTERTKLAVFLHGRLVRPLTAMILLLLSLPLLLGGENRNMYINLGLSIGTSGVFYGVSFLVNYLGGNDVLSPEMSAWLPLIAFGSLAAARWDNIRT
jgi:lipopolysaccharide export system permease protein